MGDPGAASTDSKELRRWVFGSCVFDEAEWSLTVNSRRVPIETKPLEVLRELLIRAGEVVHKEQLLERVWPHVTVVDASLPTAIYKLRAALGETGQAHDVIETVPALGYRLAVPVAVEERKIRLVEQPLRSPAPGDQGKSIPPQPPLPALTQGRRSMAILRVPVLAIVTALVAAVLALAWSPLASAWNVVFAPRADQTEVREAIRKLDIETVERLIARGWNPAIPFDKERNDALTLLLERCEWDRGHDRRKMLIMARTLIEAGAAIDRRNVYGDTAYSIAKAPRFCGPDHAVTQMIEAMCYGGDMGPKDFCLATYELTPDQRRAQGLPAKATDPSTINGARGL